VKWEIRLKVRSWQGLVFLFFDISPLMCLFPFRASRNKPNVLQHFSSSVMQNLEYCCALM